MQKNKAGYPEIGHQDDAPRAPLSFQQERVLYLNKLSGDGPLWNRISCKRLFGNISIHRLQDAIAALIERHAALRTRIGLTLGEPFQSRHEVLHDAFEYIDLSSQSDIEPQDQARAILNREYSQSMRLEGGELFKAVAVTTRQKEVWLILKLHHIISDATTLQILWNDLKVLYNSGLGGSETPAVIEIEYIDYARWLREQFGEDNTRAQEAYWLQQFAGELPKLGLPVDSIEPPALTFRGAIEKRRLSQSLIKRLQSFSLETRVIPFSTMLSAYYLLLHHYCHQDDIIIGTVFSGRHYSAKIKHLAGFFSNTVALRVILDGAPTVEEFIKYVHSLVTGAYEMQDYPFERLVKKISPGREHERNPLFRAMFNMVTSYPESRAFEGVFGEESVEPEITATQVDFFLDFHMNPEEPELRVEYNADIFSPPTIQRMLRHYVTLASKILDAPRAKVRELSMLDAAEEKLILSLGEGASEPALARDIVELLEERAARTPAQTALACAGEGITCGEFNRRANRLAATLVESGVAEGDTVAIILDRSPEMVLAVFAILKVGAAYLPIDSSFPEQRIEYIVRDSGIRCALIHRDSAHALPQTIASSLKTIPVDSEDSYTGDGSNLGRRPSGSSPAYVIYTSGSTGAPKGVVVERQAMMNTLGFLEARYALPGKTILLKTNFTFDVSATELFGWVFEDGTVAVLDKGAEKDPRQLLDAIEKYGVTHINFVPSMLDVFLSGLQERDIATIERLAYVFVAGEALKPDLVNRFHSMIHGVRLENLYGPTEAAIYATWHSLTRGAELKRVPIGAPISNTRAYILDERFSLAPVGVTGELCLAGAGLARGYLNQPELTTERFCPDPYRQGERIYRTGDWARWGDNGTIQFLGRRDGQVKIRGFRVELGEVEQSLLACRSVAEAAVTARTDQFGQQGLVAYVAMQADRDDPVETIRQELAPWLPGYMIPEVFVKLERLPRLPSGKIDLRGLPEPHRIAAPAEEQRAAATELERTIIEIAEGLLNTTGLSPSSNFFHLGGNSLLTLRFIAALDSALGTSLSPIDFLELPTISQIARFIESSQPPSQRPERIAVERPRCPSRANVPAAGM